jgi:hypothetical protein
MSLQQTVIVVVVVVVVCRIDRLSCQDEFFVNNPLNVKENYEHAFDFAIHLFQHFLSQ